MVPPISVMSTFTPSPGSVDTVLDFVGHMGNNLHGFTEVIPPPFLANDGLVNLAAGQVVEPGELAGGETFVVAEVEIGFGTVVENIDLSMLETDSSFLGSTLR